MSEAADFLTELWGQQPPGLMLLWSLRDKRSRYLESPLAASAMAPGEPDIYTGVGLAHQDHGQHRRIPNDQVVATAGLWADIDIDGGPDHKTGAHPNMDAAHQTALCVAEPTLIVLSGYGLQCWWLFDEPWRFKTRGEQRHAAKAAAQWQKLLRERSGHGLDFTHDLARVLRLPGTTNAKGGERKSVSVIDRGPRHERDELLEIASAAGDVDPGYAVGGVRPTAQIRGVSTDAAHRTVKQLIGYSPQFARTWRHERPELPSMSEIDMSLASITALAGRTDQEIAEVIALHRQANGDPKGERLDYLARTVTRARSSAQPAEPKATAKDGTLESAEWAETIRRHLTADRVPTIPLPWEPLNRALDGGLAPADVCLVAGYTSHGKSVVVDMIADCAAADGRSVHLYLTEMTAAARGLRAISRRGGIPFSKLKQRRLDVADWSRVDRALEELPYGCSIVSDWTVEDVVAHIVQSQWDLAVVDLIHGFAYSDERELSKTSSAIVRAAKASARGGHPGTTIVCAAHLNDGQMRDQRSPQRPKPGLHSIKGSSSLKQDADVVLFVWQEDDENGAPSGVGEIWLAKARDGGLGKVHVALDVTRMEFTELGTVLA